MEPLGVYLDLVTDFLKPVGDLLNICAAIVAVVVFYLWRPTARRLSIAVRRGPLGWFTLASVALALNYFRHTLCVSTGEAGQENWCTDPGGVDYRAFVLSGLAISAAGTAWFFLAARGFLAIEPVGGAGPASAALAASRAKWLARLTHRRIALWVVLAYGVYAVVREHVRTMGAWSVPRADWSVNLAWAPAAVLSGGALWALGASLAWTWSRRPSALSRATANGYRAIGIGWFATMVSHRAVLTMERQYVVEAGSLDWFLSGQELLWALLWVAEGGLALATITEYLRRTIDAEQGARLAAQAAQLRLEESARLAEGTFANLRHTLRNSIGLLAGDLHLLKLRLRRGDLDAASASAAELDRTVVRLQTTVIPLLTAGHQSGGVPAGGLPPISLHDTLLRWVTMGGDRSPAVSYLPPPDGTLVRIDPVTLMTVLDRLAENARTHGHARTLTITVDVRPGVAILGVANDGAPIPSEVMPTLFAEPTHGLGAAFVLLAREGARIALAPTDTAVQFWVTMLIDAHTGPDLPDSG